jgi:dienelactone hydrolase
MLRFLLLVLAALPGVSTLLAQSLSIGNRNVSWPNPTGVGSANLTARVVYPATVAGMDTPLLPRAGGWPTIVFLHGFGLTGSSYQPLADRWAQRGHIVVLGNTAQFDNLLQESDGRATFAALVAANATVGGPFANGIDIAAIALTGHSMGGGNVANVLAQNPGYRGGFAIAPVPPRGNNGALVTTPLGMVSGNGDVITPPASNAELYYQSLTAFAQCKFHYRMNGDANHTNLAGLFVSGAVATAVFDRSAGLGLAFCRHLFGEPTALELALGPPALAEPRLVTLSQEFAAPVVWADLPLPLASTTRLSAGMEPGIGAIAVAPAPLVGPLPTPLGELRLDPASAFVLAAGVVGTARRFDAAITMPNQPALLGAPLGVQGLGPSRIAPLWLGSVIQLAVGP